MVTSQYLLMSNLQKEKCEVLFNTSVLKQQIAYI